ncbi:MAG: tyrosine-type recombinase/integrase, partial [Pseudomonadota bacterium]
MPSLKLTDSFCRGAKCSEGLKQEDYWDTLSPGLGLRVTTGGKKTWCYRYRWQGKRRRLSLLPFGNAPAIADSDGNKIPVEMTLSAARLKANDLMAMREAGVDPGTELERAKERRIAKSENTVANALERHVAILEGRGRRPGYIRDIRALFRAHVLPNVGDMIITDVRTSDVAPIFQRLRASNSAATHNKLLAVIPPVFRSAKAEDPVTDQFDPMPTGAEPEAPTLQQLSLIWAALDHPDAPIHPLTALAVRVSALTMKRSGEVCGMLVSELNFDTKVWNIPADKMKGGRPLTVPLSGFAIELITEAMEHPLRPAKEEKPVCVFPNPRDPMKSIGQNAVGRAFRSAKRAAGLNDHGATVHTLRHTAATTLGEAGVP